MLAIVKSKALPRTNIPWSGGAGIGGGAAMLDDVPEAVVRTEAGFDLFAPF